MSSGRNDRIRKYVIAVMVIIAICCVILFACTRNDETGESQAQEAAGRTMFRLQSGKVRSFSYNSGDSVYTLEKRGGRWINDADAGMELDQEAVTSMLGCMADLRTSTIVSENLSEAAGYGIDGSEFVLKIVYESGDSDVIHIGEETPMVGINYAYIEGDNRIFAVDAGIKESFVPPERLT